MSHTVSDSLHVLGTACLARRVRASLGAVAACDSGWQRHRVHGQGTGECPFTGLVGLHHTGSETPELGIWIREDKHGLGFGGEAVRAVVQWASKRVAAKCFIYPVATQNRASRRIAEALGGVVIERRMTEKYDSVVYQIPGV